MRHACVKAIVKTIAFKVDVLRYAVVKRIIAEIVAVQFTRQIWVPDVIDLRDSCEDVSSRRVRFAGHRCDRLKKITNSVLDQLHYHS